ncbi:MAG: hypothetical protein ACK59Y_06970 [Betaproteobacteria bacterium]|jgi:hypothetical protein|nr:hypothetical protein [Betaproteobacteria bacterium]
MTDSNALRDYCKTTLQKVVADGVFKLLQNPAGIGPDGFKPSFDAGLIITNCFY